MNNESPRNPHDDAFQERLRQARCSFNLAIAATTVSFLVSILGVGLLLSNKVSEGSIATGTGLLSSAGFVKLAKDANDRLDKVLSELDDE